MDGSIRKYTKIPGVTTKEILLVVIPIAVDQFFLVAFNFINTFMISNVGADAISAVNIVGTINVFFSQIFTSISLAGTVLIAQSFGKNETVKIKKLYINIVSLALLVGFVLMILLILQSKLLIRILANGADTIVLELATMFFIGTVTIYPLQAFIDASNGSLRGIVQTKATLKISLMINVTYLLGNIIFVSLLKLGILGLCISLLISRVIGCIIAFFTTKKFSQYFVVNKVHLKMVSKKVWKLIFLTFVPFVLENLFFNGGKIIVQMMIVGLGTQMIAINAILSIVLQISEIVPVALAAATVPLVGRFVGQEDKESIRKLTILFIIVCAVIILLCDLLILPFFKEIVILFNLSLEAVNDAKVIYLWAIVFHCIFWGISFITPNALRAMGKGKFTTITSLISMWSYRIGMGYLVGIQLNYGLLGLWVMIMSEWGVRGIIFLMKLIKET